MVPYFFAMDRPNYARWLPVYIADMKSLQTVYQEFIQGNHSVSRSGQAFSKALEQSINADTKHKGGIIGISQSAAALNKWFLTAHERAAITASLKEMYGAHDGNVETAHKEGSVPRIRRDEEDITKLVNCFSSGLMENPFLCEESDVLKNFATGLVLPEIAKQSIFGSHEKGKRQMMKFVQGCKNSTEINFWDSIPSLKVITFSKLTKTAQVKASNEKLLT